MSIGIDLRERESYLNSSISLETLNIRIFLERKTLKLHVKIRTEHWYTRGNICQFIKAASFKAT